MILYFLACSPPLPESTDAVDLRLGAGDYPDPGDDNAVWWGPEVEVPPGSDVMYCLFDTYHGPDEAVHTLTTYQNRFGHHLVPMGTTASPLDYPDGTMIDCTQTGAINMAELEPIVVASATQVGDTMTDLGMDVPDGMAVKLDAEQRYVMQAHYINTGTDTILGRDVAVFDYMDPDDVVTWAAPLVTNHGDFSLPPHQETTVSFDCTFDADYNFVYMLGHMHEWGTSFKVEQIFDDVVSTVYEVPVWQPSFRDKSPVTNFSENEYSLPAGTTLRTTCSWFNGTDETIEFPFEMCDSVSLAYPLLTTEICDAGSG